MLNEDKVEELVEAIEKSFNCVTGVDFWSVVQKERGNKTEIKINIIYVDDNEDDVYKIDNNLHELDTILKNININVVSKLVFNTGDTYPNGTSSYSLKFLIEEN
jgi:hypothetical protein